MTPSAAPLREALREQAQRRYDQLLADRLPQHPDVESAVSSLLSELSEFYEYGGFVNAMGMKDQRWIDALAHACDEARERLRAVKGEMQGPVRAKLIPEAV